MREFFIGLLVVLSMILFFEFSGCIRHSVETDKSCRTDIVKQEKKMEIDQKLFLDVPLNSKAPNRCSPPNPGPAWRGVMIRAPKRVIFERDKRIGKYGAFAAIPICGYYFVDVVVDPEAKPMRLVAVDKQTGKIYSGDLVDLEPDIDEPPEDEEPVGPDKLKGLATGGYFNPNLADFVNLPEAPGIYNVHVEYRNFKSNVVTIELVEKKSG